MNNVETQLIVNSTLLMSKNAKWRVGIYTTRHFSYSSYENLPTLFGQLVASDDILGIHL